MAIRYAERVKETTTSDGTGAYALAGPAAGHQGFVAGLGDGAACAYCCTDGTDWEVAIGSLTDGSPATLSREHVLRSSNGGAEVDWPDSTAKEIFCVAPAAVFSSPYHPGYRPGRVYFQDGLVRSTNTTETLVADRLYCEPLFVADFVTLEAVGLRVNTSASATMRMALYGNLDGRPDALLVDAGTAADAVGDVRLSGLGFFAPPGWYWLAFGSTGATVIQTGDADGGQVRHYGNDDYDNPTGQFAGYRSAAVSGIDSATLPDPFGALSLGADRRAVFAGFEVAP